MSTASIYKRANEGTKLTKVQKLRVLKDTRKLLETHWTQETWRLVIDGVEKFCLYGGMENVMGLKPADYSDEYVSACSLTSTLYDALPEDNYYKMESEKLYARVLSQYESDLHRYRHSTKPDLLAYRVSALQEVNDNEGQEAVLELLDKTIAKLEGKA